MTSIDEISIEELYFKKGKESADDFKKTYIPSYRGKKPILILKNVLLPFGIEIFNKKKILNIEINPKAGNNHYNIYSLINNFEKNMADKTKFKNNDLCNDIDGKGYYQNMRKSVLGYIIRTHLFGTPNVHSFIGQMTLNDITKVRANILIEFGCVWINENNYGIIWYVKDIEVLESV